MSLTTSRHRLIALASRDLTEGTHDADVVAMLTSNGMEVKEAERTVSEMRAALRIHRLWVGVAWLGVAIVVVAAGSLGTFYLLVSFAPQ